MSVFELRSFCVRAISMLAIVGSLGACGSASVRSTSSASSAAEQGTEPKAGAEASPTPRADAASSETVAVSSHSSVAAHDEVSPEAGASEGDALDGDASDGDASDGDLLRALDEQELAKLESIPSESIPTPKEFYYRSNEWRHDLLVEPLRGVGGALVCVGSDQCYTLAALAGAELIFAMDYDGRLQFVHALYAILVPASESPDALIARFAPENQADTLALLEKELDGSPRKARLLRMFRSLRVDWYPYLQRVAARSIEGRDGSWLTTQALYDHVRSLFRAGRIVSRAGDLTGETTLRAIGKVARELGVPVRVFYMSNAEQFFPYTPAFRQNVAELPADERSIVVRTLRDKRLPNARGDKWHYIVQELVDFQERLETGVYTRSYTLIDDLVDAGAPYVGQELSTIDRKMPRGHLQRRRATRASESPRATRRRTTR